MPKTHSLFQGGNRKATTFPVTMYPSVDVDSGQWFEPDNRGAPCLFSLNRRLMWNAEPDTCGCDDIGAAAPGMAEYLENNSIAVGDIIQTHILPIATSLERIWFKVLGACPGVTFDVVVRGNSASNGGTAAVPVPVTVMTGVSVATEGTSLFVLPAPLYFDENDMLEIHITGLPPEGIQCSDFVISPVVHAYCRTNLYG